MLRTPSFWAPGSHGLSPAAVEKCADLRQGGDLGGGISLVEQCGVFCLAFQHAAALGVALPVWRATACWARERIGSPASVRQAPRRCRIQPRNPQASLVSGAPLWGQAVPSGIQSRVCRTSATVQPARKKSRHELATSLGVMERKANIRLRISAAGATRCVRRLVPVGALLVDGRCVSNHPQGNAPRDGRKQPKQSRCWLKPPGKTKAVSGTRPKRTTDSKHCVMGPASNATRPSEEKGWLSGRRGR